MEDTIISNEFNKILYDRIEAERYDKESTNGHNTFDL